jgi:hypothetical protein
MLKKFIPHFIVMGIFFILPSLSSASGALEEQLKKKQAAQQSAPNQAIQQRQQQLQKIQEQFKQERNKAIEQIQNQSVQQRQQQISNQQALQNRIKQIQGQNVVNQNNFVSGLKDQATSQYQSALTSMPKPQPIDSKALAETLQAQIAEQMKATLQNIPPEKLGVQMPGSEITDPSQVQDMATMADIWRSMEQSSEVWPLIIELQPKMLTVERQIALYADEGIKISKPAMHYVEMIDGMSAQTPELLQRPFKDVLKFMAVLEYDFNNGQNKDWLAKQMLGEKVYLANRQRLGL